MGDRACYREFCPACDAPVTVADDACPDCGEPLDHGGEGSERGHTGEGSERGERDADGGDDVGSG